MEFGLLWVPATLIAAAAQTARNATQRQLTATLGTLGATQVRFLFGLPFALVFLGLVRLVAGEQVPAMDRDFLLFATGGAVAQIVATALMLAAMRAKGFATVTAITECRLMELDVADFRRLVAQYPEVRRELERTAADRLAV